MCSFDVANLFTNIPLEETIQICLDTFYRDEQIEQPSLPEILLKKLLLKATSDVEFSFDGIMNQQIDGEAMSSPLGPMLANILIGHIEARILEVCSPLFCDRFVDDTFAVFSSENESNGFLQRLIGLHHELKFTVEGERDSQLPFMEVFVKRVGSEFIQSVYWSWSSGPSS